MHPRDGLAGHRVITIPPLLALTRSASAAGLCPDQDIPDGGCCVGGRGLRGRLAGHGRRGAAGRTRHALPPNGPPPCRARHRECAGLPRLTAPPRAQVLPADPGDPAGNANSTVVVAPAEWAAIKAKHLSVYIEFPRRTPPTAHGGERAATAAAAGPLLEMGQTLWERAAVSAAAGLGAELPYLALLHPHKKARGPSTARLLLMFLNLDPPKKSCPVGGEPKPLTPSTTHHRQSLLCDHVCNRLACGCTVSVPVRQPELKLNIPAWVLCTSWCADFEFRVTSGRFRQAPASLARPVPCGHRQGCRCVACSPLQREMITMIE